MAVDNLNYYSSWLPAWQQTDRYSSQPWCLKSKNLDIFSSSKSVKATAWTAPSAWESDVVAIDDHWKLVLKTDGKVYERQNWTDTLFIDPSVNFPSYDVSYNWRNGTYSPATWGTVKDMVVKYEWDEWKSFVVYTDRNSYTYSKVPYITEKTLENWNSLTADPYSPYSRGYAYTKAGTTWNSGTIKIKMPSCPITTVPIKVYADEYDTWDTTISLDKIYLYIKKFYYDPQDDMMVPTLKTNSQLMPVPATDIRTEPVLLEIPVAPYGYEYQVELQFKFTKKDGASTFGWDWTLYVDMNKPEEAHRLSGYTAWDYNEYYTYLPIDANRKLVDIWEYYWMPSLSFQTLYSWEWGWTEVTNAEKKTIYDFVQYMWWANDPAMDVISMIAWNESIYMIGNMNWNWYIIPCDLTWQRGTPFIAYWCTFRWATNIDYLLYLVWEDRWISQLWVYNGQELVPLLWWNQEVWEKDLIWVAEQYNFDWNMVEYRGNLVLTTSDGRIFEYWQTYWGKWWAFIHDLGANLHDSLTIDSLKAKGNDLKVDFSVTDTIEWTTATTKWSTTYQDDVPIKHYNSAWEAVYPIVLGNHLLEKEESDLYASYILPSRYCQLQFWGCANHYHFWTFESDDNVTLDPTRHYKIETTSWSYHLEFVERNGNWYTFRLSWDLPKQLSLDQVIIDPIEPWIMGYIISGWVRMLGFTSFNHFRKIWAITTTEYVEWEFRFTNLNNKLELPKSHSLQIMVKGYWDSDHTPELFSLDLVANQRDRW